MADLLSAIGPRLAALLQGDDGPRDLDAALQDSLDLVALVAGAKEMALLGCGYDAGGWLDAVADLAAECGLIVRRAGMPLIVAEEIAGLPRWYVEPLQAIWGAADIVTVTRSVRQGEGPRVVAVEEEARLLGYPLCCVVDHHARRRRYHALMVELIAASRDDETERRRFVAAELSPSLRDEADRARLVEALGVSLAPFTGIAMCPTCATEYPRGPAGARTARYRDLARTSGLIALCMTAQPALAEA